MTKNRRRRLRLASLAACGVAIAVIAFLPAPAAFANVGGNLIPHTGVLKSDGTENTNTSDPFVMRCTDHGVRGYCLYTSQDLQISAPSGRSAFQMRDTLGFFSTTGHAGDWTPKGVVFTESQIPWAVSGANHEWAPAAYQSGPNGPTYLYIPDVTDPNSPGFHTTSKIAVAWSSDGPFGPFNFLATVQIRNVSPTPYMSDPELFHDSTGNFLLWADGDGDTCGGISIGPLDFTNTVVESATKLTINGFPSAWGSGSNACTPTPPFTGTFNRPYLEGPSLFKFSNSASDLTGLPGPYTLVFPAKPKDGHVPTECTTDKGEENKDTSVIAYATSSAITGPYTYQGIIMCGSSTEWTNQATLAEMTTSGGAKRMAIIYHDSPGTYPIQRQTHADCLFYGAGTFAVAKRFPNSFTDCMSDVPNYIGMRARSNRQIVSATNNGGSPVAANRFEVREYERFNFIDLGGGHVAVKYLVNGGRYLSAATAGGTPGTSPMIADRTVVDIWERFTKVTNADGSISLKADVNGKFVQVGSDGRLYANLTSVTGDAGKFDIMHL